MTNDELKITALREYARLCRRAVENMPDRVVSGEVSLEYAADEIPRLTEDALRYDRRATQIEAGPSC